MILLQLGGQAAFVLASLAIGAKLLRLWRRTGEVPELTIGVAFAAGGGLGFLAWFALAVATLQGAAPEVIHGIAVFGLSCTTVAGISNGIGVARIYRPGASWPLALVGGCGLVMVGGLAATVAQDPEVRSGVGFWAAIVATLPVYAWGTGEAFSLAWMLHKRAKLGMAQPVVVNRAAQWGVASGATVLLVALSFASRVVHGPELPPWVSALTSALGIVAAVAIWLGFFPPPAFRARLARAYAG